MKLTDEQLEKLLVYCYGISVSGGAHNNIAKGLKKVRGTEEEELKTHHFINLIMSELARTIQAIDWLRKDLAEILSDNGFNLLYKEDAE